MRSGGCQCGSVRFECPEEPLDLYACHCRECQKQASSAFGISYIVRWPEVRLLQGTPKVWSRPTDSGSHLNCWFCPDCGSRLWHRMDGDAEIVSIKGGTFDTPLDLRNAGHIWTARKLRGLPLPPDAKTHEGEPPDPPY